MRTAQFTGVIEFDEATAVEGADGRYTAVLSPAYNTFVSPLGAYVAAVMFRAAGTHSEYDRPVSMYCQFLNMAKNDIVELEVISRRKSKRSEALQVTMTQDDKLIGETLVWMAADGLEGLDHVAQSMPSAPTPETLLTFQQLYADYPAAMKYMETRPILEWPLDKTRPAEPPWPVQELMAARESLPPFVRGWSRLQPKATFDDPIVSAARYLMPLDFMPVGATQQPHAGAMVFPQSLDFQVLFHNSAPGTEWMYCEGESLIASGGVVHASGRVWSEDGKLLATGSQQAFQRVMQAEAFFNREG